MFSVVDQIDFFTVFWSIFVKYRAKFLRYDPKYDLKHFENRFTIYIDVSKNMLLLLFYFDFFSPYNVSIGNGSNQLKFVPTMKKSLKRDNSVERFAAILSKNRNRSVYRVPAECSVWVR